MRHVRLTHYRLVAFHLENIDRKKARQYAAKIHNAVNPYIIVEKRLDGKYNVIGGFKYVSALKMLEKKTALLCFVVRPFRSEQERKLAILNHCVKDNEDKKYWELLIHELKHEWNMDDDSIAESMDEDASKIRQHLFRQIIPHSYIKEANKLGIKPLIQAIFLNKLYSYQEKCLLTELFLYTPEDTRINGNHLFLYRKYREKYILFDDFYKAKKQVLQALNPKKPIDEYWQIIPHPKTLEDYLADYEVYNLYTQMY
ncbi:hypothetical protein SAMN05421676_101416 [Salinibacillus kushneri]|uniref:Uncharacterized protein n=1 Tax=Salinibacillus kushneri TaxID=237682 RepID=A0A1H9Z7C8_9BACI|nr:hypothetical protein [Salinibacillus kushneri]SES77456.1 hypothetical protein SAMN05421676_101416 [Salinibacillus kushneri]